MSLDEVRKEALSLLKKHGLNKWSFNWLVKRDVFAMCNYKKKTIYLNRSKTLHESNPKRITNSILHEIAHALDFINRGKSDHGPEWQKIAKSIGCNANKYGDESGLDKEKIYKWTGSCPDCDRKWYYNVKPKKPLRCPTHKSQLVYKFNKRIKGYSEYIQENYSRPIKSTI
ncbi:MAG: SprT-like protein [uncultured marine phage]|uniref:SprT-like protein n=1 Tax=uncultured marine phage TaxID=707152 RepID=A0A8D9C8E2_9VIRU|nr:MAG: SprT-like protein [uncultured marine phage]